MRETRSLERWTNIVLAGAALVVMFALTGLGLVIWLAVKKPKRPPGLPGLGRPAMTPEPAPSSSA